MNFDQVNRNLAKNRKEMADLQNKAASQKNMNKPSDDPIAAARVLSARVDLSGNTQFNKSLGYARSFLEYTDQSLGDLTENLIRAKELAISQANDASASGQSRKVVAREISQIFDQVIQIGNRKLGDRFIFGGFKTQTTPFSIEGQYQGDAGEMQIQTDKQSYVPINMPGSKVFLGEGHNSFGVTSATPQQALTIEQFKEEQQTSAEKNMVPQKQQQEDSPETDLRAPASRGQGNDDMLVENPGLIEPNEATGENLFNVVEKMYVALNTNDKTGIQNAIEDMDRAISQVVMARAQVGARSMALDNARETLQKAKVDNNVTISELEDADIFQTVSDMNKTESALKATLQTSGKLVQPSLLDFLR
ncbi:MAG: flagellar hook-associated protein FlgL [Bdellovibrionales bacterium]|nr:flagellar hook-associated protein FlgL [Bdellovibrionales bacterium]